MTIAVRDAAGALVPVIGISIRDASNALVTVLGGVARDASGAPQTFFAATVGGGGSSGLIATPSSPTASKTAGTSGGSRVVTTPSITVTVTGGPGSYTYAWSRVSGDLAITATAPTAATSAFSATLAADTERFAQFVCTATEAVTGRTATATVNVELYLVLTSGGVQP